MTGEILDGKYRIDKRLGAGGMGNVYLATHLGTTRTVAVKVIAPKWAAEPHFLVRFQREAQACGRLRHPNIVNVTDFGIARGARGEVPYLVMELLDGQTLSDFQKSHPQMPLPLIADLLDQIGLALVEAHGHGIVHRDLKPDNIWLEPNGRGGYTVKVLDFGVAKVKMQGGGWAPAPAEAPETPAVQRPPGSDEAETIAMEAARGRAPREVRTRVEDSQKVAIERTPYGLSPTPFDSDPGAQTMPGSLIGTPAYMSPEQAMGRELDYRSDIYSLAVVAYSLVCGRLPFTGKPADLIEFHKRGEVPPPAGIRKIPRDVSDAILAGLEREPADRPASALVFTRRFHNAVDAEFLALRRSKAFLLQHLATFAFLLPPIYGILVAVTAILTSSMRKILPTAVLQAVFIPLGVAVVLVFFDNLMRAAAALTALDEQAGIRKLVSFRVFWKLIKMIPALVVTQARALWLFGPGWITGDCLWPVLCAVEKMKSAAAIQRSRDLMTGLRSAGRALAIRHLALATFVIAAGVKSVLLRLGPVDEAYMVTSALWFPIFAVYAAAPLFLYDRTAARETGPLLQLDRAPEVRITARALSISSMLWLAAAALYLMYQPVKSWLFGR